MTKSGQTGFSRIEFELRTQTHDSFEALVAALLDGLVPGFAQARRLGELDCMGVDVYATDPATGQETIAVQCKGLELAFDAKHLAMLQKEIRKFRRKGPTVREYWLVINKRMSADDKALITADLAALVTASKAQEARLFDLPGFVKHLRDMARSKIGELSDQRRIDLREQYEARLKVVNYIEGVPFERSSREIDPTDWIVRKVGAYLDSIHPDHVGKDRTPPRFLLTAGFGFGKTSTIHAIADRWMAKGRKALYVPAALLPDMAFVNGAGVTEGLLLLIDPEMLSHHPLVQLIMRETLRKELARAKDWILLIDALDESPHWEHHAKLAALWGGVVDLGLPVVASVREELFHLRRQEFEAGDGGRFGEPFFDVLKLTDWPDALIGEFLDRFQADRVDKPPAQFRRLRALAASGTYNDIYGDIPKRPLFLGMLATDAWRDIEPERELHRLYETYLRRKLHEDRYSASAEGKVVRIGSLGIRLGSDEFTERLMQMMTVVAGRMVGTIGEGGLALISEVELIGSAESIGASFERAEELALNSVLQPNGRGTQGRMFRFAHQSFQDWFAAKHLVESGLDWRSDRYAPAVQFFADLMANDRA